MHAFVTGATGLLGSNLTRALVAHGHQVSALVRSRAKAERQLGDLPIRVVEGDIAHVEGFADALEGCDTLFHTAAYFREYFQPGDHWPTLRALNVDATIALLRAAERHGVRRAVHTSSSGVIGMRPGQQWGDESDAPDDLALANLYFRSKALAEQEIARFLETSQLDVMLALPGWMFGPGDAAPTSSGQLVRDFIERRLPGLFDGGGAPCDARDVAAGMIAIAERGRRGERYILGGDAWVTFSELAQLLEQVSGVRRPALMIPIPAALALGAVSELWSQISGRPVLITRAGIRTLQHRRTTRSDKARRELGVSFRPLAETLRDEVAWMRA